MRRKFCIRLAMILMAALLIIPVRAEECSINPKEYVLKTRGIGEYSIAPDSFSVKFIVESESGSVKGATKDNSEKISNIRKSIEQLKVPNLKEY